jgi:hypothetical protein
MSREAVKHIKTWHERCEEHPDHQERIISERMIQARMQEEIDELRQALETNQEPFEYWSVADGWVKIDELREHFDSVGCGTIYKSAGDGRSPLYTAPPKTTDLTCVCGAVWEGETMVHSPPKREWVGLTKEDMPDGDNPMFDTNEFYAGMAWAEAKLKDKNT